MSFFQKLFGKGANKAEQSSTGYTSRDNVGLRYQSEQHAQNSWIGAHMSEGGCPFLAFSFPNLEAARRAILQLSFIHEASDTHELIATEVVEFGCHTTSGGEGQVVIIGHGVDQEIWQESKEKLQAAGGTLFRENNEPTGVKNAPAQGGNAAAVQVVREFTKGPSTYRVLKASSKANALAYLKQNPVKRPQFYIVVETPQGNFGRDIDGIYKEKG